MWKIGWDHNYTVYRLWSKTLVGVGPTGLNLLDAESGKNVSKEIREPDRDLLPGDNLAAIFVPPLRSISLDTTMPAGQDFGGKNASQNEQSPESAAKLQAFMEHDKSRQPRENRLQRYDDCDVGRCDHLLRPDLDTEGQRGG